MTIEPLRKKVTYEELKEVLRTLPKSDFKPNGIILHNTWFPDLAMVNDYLAGTNKNGKNKGLKKWTEGQLIDNWWVNYKKAGWYSGPHFFIFPTGIWIATPLHMRGTHSPSFNKTRYGIEMIGEYDKEVLPESIKKDTVLVMKALFDHMKVAPDEQTLKFHGEDPKTSHKGCPGKSVRNKKMWLDLIKEK